MGLALPGGGSSQKGENWGWSLKDELGCARHEGWRKG